MKVIGAGFGRTGTLSLKTALDKLGFGPCYHMTEVFDKPDHVAFWDEAVENVRRGQRVQWEEVFSGYEATVDWPACIFYEELMKAYPDAKVLLSVRDPQRWYDSVEGTIAKMSSSGAFSPRALLFTAAGLLVPSMRRAPSMAQKIIANGTFDGHFADRERAVEIFERHNERVKRRVPSEKLLVFEVKEGWGPLCEFLGVGVPDEPFPHLNDRQQFPKMMRRQMATALAPALGRAIAAASALLLAAWCLRAGLLKFSTRDRAWTSEPLSSFPLLTHLSARGIIGHTRRVRVAGVYRRVRTGLAYSPSAGSSPQPRGDRCTAGGVEGRGRCVRM